MVRRKKTVNLDNVYAHDSEKISYVDETNIDLHAPCLMGGVNVGTNEGNMFDNFEAYFGGIDSLKQPSIIFYHNFSKGDGEDIAVGLHENRRSQAEICRDGMKRIIFIVYDERITFTCSLLLLGPQTSIKKYGELITKRTGKEMLKGDWDHNKTKPGKLNEMPEEFIAYGKRDVEILQQLIIDYGPKWTKYSKVPKYTIGSTSKLALKNNLHERNFWDKEISANWYEKFDEERPDANKEDGYNLHVGPGYASYYGGIVSYNPNYVGKDVIAECGKYDINSSYPFQMKGKLPYGKPSPIPYGADDCVFIHVRITSIKMKPDRYIGCFPMGRTIQGDSGLTGDGKGRIDKIFYLPEFELLRQVYEIEFVEYKRTYFRQRPGMAKYIKKLEKIKMEGTKGSIDVEYAKLLMNSVSGKMGEKIKKKSTFFGDELVDGHYPILEKTEINDEDDDSYLPAIMVITSRGRISLVKSILPLGNRFLYCDTDSIFCIGKADHLDIDDKRFGAFKDEVAGDPIVKFKVLKRKCYGYVTKSGEHVYKVAGLNEEQKDIKWEDFKPGLEVAVKRKTRKYKGITLQIQKYEV